MFGKSKVRKDFEDAYKAGNEALMNKLLGENPWLIDEWESRQDGAQGDILLILAALGVMEDEIGGPAPLDEISFSLRVDFKKKLDDAQINALLAEGENMGYCRRAQNGWQLTAEGGKKADNYLNAHAVQ